MIKVRLNLRKVAAIAICLAGTTLFSGCSKPDPEPDPEPTFRLEPNRTIPTEIIATNVENSSSEIATVKIVSRKSSEEISSAEYKDGGFRFNLPETLPDKYLYSPEYYWSGVISDKEARGCEIAFLAYNSVGKKIGKFEVRINYYDDVYYHYVDRDFTFTRNDGYFDCSFKKGWNIAYRYSLKISTEEPSELNFKWYFYRDPLTNEEQGEKAGKEFCECRKNNSESTCIDRLNTNYKSYINSDQFYIGANKNSCGYHFYKVIK